jgi:uncharacterized protein with NAD-binding domain and iron-sulfur cluster
VRSGVVAGAAGAMSLGAGAAFGITPPTKRRVVVLGGGVGGLTAAHELAERGFAVTVVEPKAFGGKARSITVPGTGTGGRGDLPGEHGFRFFPGFYKNIPDTFARIPVAGNTHGVLDHLVDAHQELLTLPNQGQLWLMPTANADGIEEGMRTLVTTLGIGAGVPANEIEYFVRKLLVFFTSSDARRLGQWEYLSWTKFTNSDNFSPMYRTVFGTGLTKDLVAAKGNSASTRTVGLMAEAFVYAMLAQSSPQIRKESGYGNADRLLNLPTSEAWINPWIAHLKQLGVRFVSGYRAAHVAMQSNAITGVTLQPTDANGDARTGTQPTITADWYVFAMPVERMMPLLSTQVLAADPQLSRLRNLKTDWMNGIQFFLNRMPALPVNGHVAFLDTPWALTSIDQGLFWNTNIAQRYGDGRTQDVYSVDISDFFTPGILYNKAAVDCTPDEIAAEVWAQMKRALNRPGKTVLSDDMVVRWFLDPAIHYPSGLSKAAANREPLLINTAGSLDDRPNATTKIRNMFLASDYVRTNVDLATMEGANEAGRQAANAILQRSGASATPASLGTLWQPQELSAVRTLDATLYKAGLPNALDVVPPSLPI